MSRKLYIKTFGCQMNEYDSSRIADVLAESHDLELTANPEDADVLLLNTCSIREKAQEKVFSQLGRWRNWKQARPDLIIGVGGCVASQEGAAIQQRAPYVDMVFGPQTIHRLPGMLNRVQGTQKKVVDISFPEIEKFDCLPTPSVNGPSAFVSIMEGCSKYCTFCVVPYTRGEEVSRPFDDVIAEVASLAARGVREVNLLGQNVNAFQGTMADGTVADLALLIQYVAAIDKIDRIRFTTSHPIEFSDSLINVFGEVPELVNHVHLPVQSGSDRILTAMKRGHTADDYRDTIKRLRAVRPGIAVSSDFIIGFPGESDTDFNATMQLVDDIGFDQSYSFLYSPRPGTPAADMIDDTTLLIKKHRLAIIQDVLAKNVGALSQAMIGSVQRVLVEGPSKKPLEDNAAPLMSGRAESGRIVTFAGDAALYGRFVDVRIVSARTSSLQGDVIAALEDNHALKMHSDSAQREVRIA